MPQLIVSSQACSQRAAVADAHAPVIGGIRAAGTASDRGLRAADRAVGDGHLPERAHPWSQSRRVARPARLAPEQRRTPRHDRGRADARDADRLERCGGSPARRRDRLALVSDPRSRLAIGAELARVRARSDDPRRRACQQTRARSVPIREASARARDVIRSPRGYFFSFSVSPESAAMNASWGTSTRPTIFMRFLPSFCFSSSLRLRVMSPP